MRINPRLAVVLFIVLFAGGVKTSMGATQFALQPGQKIPIFELKDQAGKVRLLTLSKDRMVCC